MFRRPKARTLGLQKRSGDWRNSVLSILTDSCCVVPASDSTWKDHVVQHVFGFHTEFQHHSTLSPQLIGHALGLPGLSFG